MGYLNLSAGLSSCFFCLVLVLMVQKYSLSIRISGELKCKYPYILERNPCTKKMKYAKLPELDPFYLQSSGYLSSCRPVAYIRDTVRKVLHVRADADWSISRPGAQDHRRAKQTIHVPQVAYLGKGGRRTQPCPPARRSIIYLLYIAVTGNFSVSFQQVNIFLRAYGTSSFTFVTDIAYILHLYMAVKECCNQVKKCDRFWK